MLDGPEGFSGGNDDFGDEADMFADLDALEEMEQDEQQDAPTETPEEEAQRLQQEKEQAETREQEHQQQNAARKLAEQQQQAADHKRADALFGDDNLAPEVFGADAEEDLLDLLPEEDAVTPVKPEDSASPSTTPRASNELVTPELDETEAVSSDDVAAALDKMDTPVPEPIASDVYSHQEVADNFNRNSQKKFSRESQLKQLTVYQQGVDDTQAAVGSSVKGTLKSTPVFISLNPDIQATNDAQIEKASDPDNIKRHAKEVQTYIDLPDDDPNKEKLRNKYKQGIAERYFEGNEDKADAYLTRLESKEVQQQVKQLENADLLYNVAQEDPDKADALKPLLEAGDEESLAEAREIIASMENGQALLEEFDAVHTFDPTFSPAEAANFLQTNAQISELPLPPEQQDAVLDQLSDVSGQFDNADITVEDGRYVRIQLPSVSEPLEIDSLSGTAPRMGEVEFTRLNLRALRAASLLHFSADKGNALLSTQSQNTSYQLLYAILPPRYSQAGVSKPLLLDGQTLIEKLQLDGSPDDARFKLIEYGAFDSNGLNANGAHELYRRISVQIGDSLNRVEELNADDLLLN